MRSDRTYEGYLRQRSDDLTEASSTEVLIRPARPDDADQIWGVIEPVIRAGETYALDQDMSRGAALAFWMAPEHRAFVAVDNERIIGTYFLRPNHHGGGHHVANCGYVTAASSARKGVARAMCFHSLAEASQRGFRAIQFNFVVSTNERAVRLWQSMGFGIVGRLPGAFLHPTKGYVDVFVMYRDLVTADESPAGA